MSIVGGGKAGRVLLVATLCLVLMGTVSASNTHEWTLDGSCDFSDSVGTATAFCNGGVDDTATGKVDEAVSLTVGDDEYLDISGVDSEISSPVSISMWVRTPNNAGGTQYAFSHDGTRFSIAKNNRGSNGWEFNIYDGSHNTITSGIETTDWIFVTATYDGSNMEFYVDGNSQGTDTASSIDSKFEGTGLGTQSELKGASQDVNIDEVRIYDEELTDSEVQNLYNSYTNSPPNFDSVSTTPSSWTLGSSVDVSAVVSDGDGTVSGVSVDVWEDGQQIVSDASLSDLDGDGTWEIDNLFTADEKSVYYNYTLTATDNDGATSTYSDNQFISDDAPTININDPSNQSYFKYDVPLSVGVSDNDGVPSEDYDCTVDKDGSQVDSFYLKEGLNSSYSSTIDSDLGTHNVDVSCSDPAGNTGSSSESYTVEAFTVETVSSASTVYETVNRSFQLDLKTGSMVNNVEFNLDYNGNTKDSKTFASTGVKTLRPDLYHEIPLVENNQTSKNWEIVFDVNKTDLQTSTTSIITGSTATQNQEVRHAYNFNEHFLTNGFTQLEGSKLDYTAQVNKLSPNAQGTVTGETRFNQTGKTKTLSKNGFNYTNVFNTDLIGSDSKTFSLNTDFTLNFKNSVRNFSSSKNIQLDKIVIEDSSNGDNAKTLVYNSKDEVTTNNQKSDLNLGLQVWNPDQPDKVRSYNFNDNDTATHEFYLNPGYASVKAQSFKADGNQTDWNTDYKFLPDDYSKRKHYLINESLDNETTNINLYMLEYSETQNIDFELLDTDLRPLKRHVVRVERVFSGDGETRTVAMLRTGQQGKDSTFLDPDEQYIYTVFNPDGELVEQIGPQSISGLSTTLEISPEETVIYSNLVNDVQISDVQENNQSLVVEYVSETNRLNNMSLKVFNDQTFGTTLIDKDFNTNPQGRLSVSGYNASNQSISYRLEATFGEDTVTLQTGSYGEIDQTYGDTGIFMGLIMFLALTITGLWRPSASIGLGIVGLFMMYFIGFVSISQTALISVVALGALIVWRMS